MILRLVYSFFFFSFVTGNQRGHYGYPVHGFISANPIQSINPKESRIETKSFTMERLSDGSSSYQVPSPVKFFEEPSEYKEKTMCFTPPMVHKMIKVALEYVSKMPSDINNIIGKLDKELGRMSDEENIEDNKPLYQLDPKILFQMLDQPRSGKKKNVVLKYELPSSKEPLCREALEKLIEIAYTAYRELEKHPQCRDYLYNFASRQPEDHSKSQQDRGPDLQSLIVTILDQIDKRKPNSNNVPDSDRYGDLSPESQTPKTIKEHNIPQIHEYHIHQNPLIHEFKIHHKYSVPEEYNEQQVEEYKIHKYSVSEGQTYDGPQVQEYSIPNYGVPEGPEHNGPQVKEYNIPKYSLPEGPEHNGPQGQGYNSPKYGVPEGPEHNGPLGQGYNSPKYGVPEGPEHNGPLGQGYNSPKYGVPEGPEHNGPLGQGYNSPKYGVPEGPEHNGPQGQGYNIPKYGMPEGPDLKGPLGQEYNIPTYAVPEGPEHNGPQGQGYNIPKYGVPKEPEYNGPQGQGYNIPKYGVPDDQEYNKPKVQKYNINKYGELQTYDVPRVEEYIKINEYNLPEIHDHNFIEKNHEYNVPKIKGYAITQTHEYNEPLIQDITIPQVKINTPETDETIHETINEPMNILIKLLQNSNQPDSGKLMDRLINIVEDNQSNFQPTIFKILLSLLSAHKQKSIPRFNDIFLLLLDSQRNRDWPWNDRLTEYLLSYLIPDQTGRLNPRIVDIILDIYKKRPNEKHIEYILTLLKPIKAGNLDNRIRDLIIKLVSLYLNNVLRPEYVDILFKLLKPALNGVSIPKEFEISDKLSKWKETGISPNQLNGVFAILKPYANGHKDHRPVDIIHFFLTNGRRLNPKHFDFILSFLNPENGVPNTRHLDIINFLLNNVQQYPKHTNILLSLLEDDSTGVLGSRFLEILLFLDSNDLLTPELIESLINLLTSDVTGKLDDNQVKTLFIQLAPFKQSNPKLVVDVLTLLNQGGLHGSIAKWLETTNKNFALPNRYSNPNAFKVVLDDVPRKQDTIEFRRPDDGYTTTDIEQKIPDLDFMSIFKWLDRQGLLTPDQGSNHDLVNKVMNILKQQELGVVELTYMLKHVKPLIYQPVYYVKYRLPVLTFISNMKSLLQRNPKLNADPMKLLQELVVISNVTEVSPNLQGYPKEEILKLTFNDGDLVQAKILDEQNLGLNDQIKFVHGLSSDISPEEILQLNKMNEAKYFHKLKEVKGVPPNQLTLKDVDRFIDVPPVQYRNIELKPAVALTKTVKHQTYIARADQKQDALDQNIALPGPQS